MMKKYLLLILGASLVLSIGCSNSDPAAPQEEALNFEVIGNDAPDSYDAAMNELAEMDIVVPDPITPEHMQEVNSLDINADVAVVDQGTLNEDDRPNFRRVIRHLHEGFQSVRECVANSDDPRLHRLAVGAHHAFRQGLRALENGHPRRALELFHRSNRILNLVTRICNSEGGERN
jgi:hypothetical protein